MILLSIISANGGNSFWRKRGERREKGIFPASVSFTRDLHSLDSLSRKAAAIFSTTLWWRTRRRYKIFKLAEDTDSLNYLSGKRYILLMKWTCRGLWLPMPPGGAHP